MSSHPPGEVSNRRKAAAIRLLSATVDDESAPIYLGRLTLPMLELT
jgi:hypothetical protein